MLLAIGYYCNNFLEGHARILLRYVQLYSILTKDRNCYFVNVTSPFSCYTTDKVLGSLLPKIRCVSIETRSLGILEPSLQEFSGLILRKITKPLFVIHGWLPYPEYTVTSIAINHQSSINNIFVAYDRKYFYRLLRAFHRLGRRSQSYVLNPYYNGKIGSTTFVKILYPPLDPALISLSDRYNEFFTTEDDNVTFRFMGRFSESRGVWELIRAFKRFNARNPYAKCKLIIDSFIEGLNCTCYKRIGGNIEIIITNPYRITYNPTDLITDILMRYIKSSYVMLPYKRWQFVEPPLTLMEALAMGSYVVTTSILKPYINEKLAYVIENDNLEDRLVDSIEFLYEIYGSRWYRLVRRHAKSYAKNIFEGVQNSFQKLLDNAMSNF